MSFKNEEAEEEPVDGRYTMVLKRDILNCLQLHFIHNYNIVKTTY